MDIGLSINAADGLILIALFLLYAPVAWLCYRRLVPCLFPAARRLATLLLAAQILVIAISIGFQAASQFERWLWHLHEEWNIPATLAAVQLAVVGGVAVLASIVGEPRERWRQLYLAAMGLVFLFLAADEFLAIHEFVQDWEGRYLVLGMVVCTATLLLAWRSPRAIAMWLLLLLAGLALSSAGALLVNAIPLLCDFSIAFVRVPGCLDLYVLEEAMEFLGIWLTLVAILGMKSAVAPAPTGRLSRRLYALPAFAIAALLINAYLPRLELAILARPSAARFESGLLLQGYRIDPVSGDLNVTLYASASQAEVMKLGYSVHLVDQASGESIASHDEWADRQHGVWLFGPDYAPLYRQRLVLKLTADSPANRAFRIVLTVWQKKGGVFVRQNILTSDLPSLSETEVVLGEHVVQAQGAGSLSPESALAVFDNGFALEAVELPPQATAGETLRIPVSWHSAAAAVEDYAQFLHLGHAESGAWWGYDQAPLGSRLPTRLWYPGLADTEIWQMPLPPDLADGSYEIFTGIYRSRDGVRVPARDADGTPFQDARVPVGILRVAGDG